MAIRYTHHSINEKWRKAVKNDPTLTEAQKKELIRDARKTVFFENVEELIVTILSIILGIGFMAFIYWLFSAK